MKTETLIGKSVPRIDSIRKATGAAKYTADLFLSGMLHAKVLRSPYPHARILDIDTSKAEQLEGVRAVITGKDTKGVKWGVFPYTQDHGMIATDKVRFIGEEVAAVAAVTEEIAQRAVELIDVTYEELPAVFDPEKAMKDDKLIHEDRGTNINVHVDIDVGDVDAAFGEAEIVLEDVFKSAGEAYAMMEPYSVVADFNSEGYLDLWIPNAGPHVRAKALSNLLKMPLNKVRVRKIDIGGAFGGRSEVSPSDVVTALLSIKSRQPVKLVLSREETFTATRQVHDMIVYLKTGADANGMIIARDARVIYDGGAYSSTGPIATSVPFYVYEETYK
ncbi:MAG: molybdopterin-dependent oxidoreductase, partial [Candidatus Thermoplasmatota archaeon]|nr:molybdopterin-dependent oxidoreductase [Candidatus Thermoplasmatota archaeon]